MAEHVCITQRYSPMLQTLQILAIMLVAVAMALALAHALELPGKLRLPKSHYLAVQQIYYPGFTIGGIAEPVALLVLLALVVVTPTGTSAFWLNIAALVALLAMHATYWLMTHPVNNFWLKDAELKSAPAGFFSFDPLARAGSGPASDWQLLRNRWEISHVVRAAFGIVSLILLVTAATIQV